MIRFYERFQKNKRWIKNADTSLAEINPTLMISLFVSPTSLVGGGFFTWTSVEVLFIGFEGWEVGLLIFDDPPSTCLTPNSDFSEKDLRAWAECLVRLQDQAWL